MGFYIKLLVHIHPTKLGLQKESISIFLILLEPSCLKKKWGLPLNMWTESILTATYLINRLPTAVLSGRSLYDSLKSNEPYDDGGDCADIGNESAPNKSTHDLRVITVDSVARNKDNIQSKTNTSLTDSESIEFIGSNLVGRILGKKTHIRRSENGQPLQSSLTSDYEGQALSNNVGGNLPSNAHGLPSANSDGKPPIGESFANLPQRGHVPSTFTNGNILPQNGFTHPANIPSNNYPFYSQPMYAFLNMPTYANPNPTGLFANPLGLVTPFVRWIEDYPLPDGLKMPSHIGSYDGKGDPDNFLHLFEGAIRMQRWLMLVACHMFTYTLKDSARIWWNSQKACSILNYEDLKAKFRSHFSQQKKFTKTHMVMHNIKQRENKSTRAFITRYTDDTLQILGLHEDQRTSGFIHGLRTRILVEHLSTNLPLTYKGLMEKSPREILATERAASFEPPPKMFYEIPPSTVISIKITDTIPMIADTSKKDKSTAPVEAPILMISKEDYATKNTVSESMAYKEEITFTPVTRVSNAPVIIEAAVFGRKLGRVYMDSRSTCEVIYEHYFEKLNPTIKATRVNMKTPFVGFSGKHSWSVGEVPLEITIGEHPLSRTKTLNFIIVKSDSPHNMLVRKTALQKIGIVVSINLFEAINFHTKKKVSENVL
ncbi:reverse transcriptase domain-containing protein [Tanacetum coccineum]|uniref:Reverse transcriptase domain-containing protein n=1 Tax=Tanacetum coccineum TaxID=301880 RepID=A0ABQ5G9U5_9ASTR